LVIYGQGAPGANGLFFADAGNAVTMFRMGQTIGGRYSLLPVAPPGVPVDLGSDNGNNVFWNIKGSNVVALNGFAQGASVGLTTNVTVAGPSNTVLQLQFKGGILTGVLPGP
jgi:hypothetical protein